MDDIAQCWIDAMLAFYARGCRYLQLDDTSWGEFCSAEKRAAYAARGIDVDRVGRLYVACLQLALSPQCGFSSTEEGNILTEEDQWAKIRLIVEIAREVWPDAL